MGIVNEFFVKKLAAECVIRRYKEGCIFDKNRCGQCVCNGAIHAPLQEWTAALCEAEVDFRSNLRRAAEMETINTIFMEENRKADEEKRKAKAEETAVRRKRREEREEQKRIEDNKNMVDNDVTSMWAFLICIIILSIIVGGIAAFFGGDTVAIIAFGVVILSILTGILFKKYQYKKYCQ